MDGKYSGNYLKVLGTYISFPENIKFSKVWSILQTVA